MLLTFLVCGVLLEKIADFDVEVRQEGGFLGPGFVSVYIREGDDITRLQDVEALVELTFAAGGEPDVFGHHGGADDSCLFGFHEGNGLVRMFRQQMVAKEALRQLPVFGQKFGVFHQGMHPIDSAFGLFILDAVAGLRIVFHNLAGPAIAVFANLEEDYVTGFRHAKLVVIHEFYHRMVIEKSEQEHREGADDIRPDGFHHDICRDEAKRFLLLLFPFLQSFFQPFRLNLAPVFSVCFRVVTKIVLGLIVVAASAFVVASSDFRIKRLAGFIDIQRKTPFASAGRAGMPCSDTSILLQTKTAIHYLSLKNVDSQNASKNVYKLLIPQRSILRQSD